MMEKETLTPSLPVKKPNVVPAVDIISSNNDLFFEIFLRQPVKSLVRFKAVSRLWGSFISSPEFTRAHTSSLIEKQPNSILPHSGIYFYYSFNDEAPKLDAVSLSSNSLPSVSSMEELGVRIGSPFKVLQSCNGLLLCSLTTRFNMIFIFVFNPTMQKVYRLPFVSNDCRERELVQSFHLAYDPSVSSHYKVICIKKVGPDLRSLLQVFIYTSDSDSWRKSGYMFDQLSPMLFNSGLFWNGGIHWIGEHHSLHFNVDSEIMRRRQMPPKPRGSSLKKIRYFGEWNGHLHFIHIKSLSSIKFNIMEIDKVTLKWFVKYCVHLADIIHAFPENEVNWLERNPWYHFNILAIVRGDKEEDSELVFAIPEKVISYNIIRKRVKVLRYMPWKAFEKLQIGCCCSYPYAESLATFQPSVVGQLGS